jgi:AraC-like DNA-binding protein
VDPLAYLLDGPRARDAFTLRAVLDPPWCMRVEDRAPLAVVAMVRGHAWVRPDGAAPVQLRPGDVAIARGPDPYTVADDLADPVQVVIRPGDRCTTPDGSDLHDAMSLGVRTWGNSATGRTVMLVGTYHADSELSQRLLRCLPALAVLHDEPTAAPLVALLASEVQREELGQSIVLDRQLDLLLITALRAWFARPDSSPPAWYNASADPVVGPALRLLHQSPGHPWTVADLAARAGVSRAALGRRFTAVVGEPPMAYLTGWRLTLAADLLREPDLTLAAVARRVGYATPFALSAAFKRVRGISPEQYRRNSGRARSHAT